MPLHHRSIPHVFTAIAVAITTISIPVFALAGDSPKSLPSRADVDFFEKRIRPVLAAKCWKCHSSKKQEAGLRLDSRGAIAKGGDGGPVVVLKKPEDSRLIDVLKHTGDVKMPPEEKLPQATVDAFATWVKQGLPWPKSSTTSPGSPTDATLLRTHWAFQPIRAVQPPAVKNRHWLQTPIDRFLLAKLESAGLSPSQRADKQTLLRRLTFDVTGLPPTPDELAAFLADNSPQAYAKVVDRLLASPRYGERWGRFWLDVARYADNKGYVFFEEKTFPWAYTYRDYVVRALNEDRPYDRFLREQLAADQLDLGADKRPLAALGFLTLGGRFMNNVHDVFDDRIDVVTRGLLGITATCARCHDHKFDPVSQAEYYALYGVFRSSVEPMLPPRFQPTPATSDDQTFETEMQKRLKALDDFVAKKRRDLIDDGRKRAEAYLLAAHAQRHQPPTDEFMLLTPAGELHPTMIHRWQLAIAKAKRTRDPLWAIWHFYADIPDDQFAAKSAGVTQRLLSLDPKVTSVNSLLLAAFRKQPPKTMKDVAARYAVVLHAVKKEWESAVQQAAKRNGAQPARLVNDDKERVRLVFYGPGSPPNVPRMLGYGFLSLLPDRESQGQFQKLIKAVEQWAMTGKGAPPRAMVLIDAERPYQPRIFHRGNPSRLGDPVPRQLPRFLDGRSTRLRNGSGRLELANAIVRPDNPLTARVIGNRLWHWHFGSGLVTTPSDFGTRSSPPSHPALLDYLASELIRSGWSLKHLHRLILLSAVYQQDSGTDTLTSNESSRAAANTRVKACLATDPENRLLWRMNRRRLAFETMRDTLLASSGSLDQTIGGKAVQLLKEPFNTRRTVYGFVDRMNLPGLYRAFDFPSPAATSPKREATMIPPQALYLMNHAFVREAARRLMQRKDVVSLTDVNRRVSRVYAILFAREPSVRERELARRYFGDRPSAERWVVWTHALLMTNEFVFVD